MPFLNSFIFKQMFDSGKQIWHFKLSKGYIYNQAYKYCGQILPHYNKIKHYH